MEPIVHLVILSAFLVRAQQLTALPVRLQVQIRPFWMEMHVLSQDLALLGHMLKLQRMFVRHAIVVAVHVQETQITVLLVLVHCTT